MWWDQAKWAELTNIDFEIWPNKLENFLCFLLFEEKKSAHLLLSLELTTQFSCCFLLHIAIKCLIQLCRKLTISYSRLPSHFAWLHPIQGWWAMLSEKHSVQATQYYTTVLKQMIKDEKHFKMATIVWLPSTREWLFGFNASGHCLVRVCILNYLRVGLRITITQSHMHTMQQTYTHKAVTRRDEVKKLLSRRRQSEYSIHFLTLS